MSVNIFSTKVVIGDTIFYVSYWSRDRHLTWSPEPCEGLAARSAKGVPSFLSYFKTLSIGPAPGIEPATSRSAVKRSTDWANPTNNNKDNKKSIPQMQSIIKHNKFFAISRIISRNQFWISRFQAFT